MEPRQLDRRGCPLEELRDADRLESFVRLQPSVQRAQKVIAIVGVLLPRVLAVEDDRGEVRPALVRKALPRAFELGDHVADGILRLHVAVDEADAIA